MLRMSRFIWILSLVLTSPSAPDLAEVQRFRLIPDESQIVTKIQDSFGNIVNGALLCQSLSRTHLF